MIREMVKIFCRCTLIRSAELAYRCSNQHKFHREWRYQGTKSGGWPRYRMPPGQSSVSVLFDKFGPCAIPAQKGTSMCLHRRRRSLFVASELTASCIPPPPPPPFSILSLGLPEPLAHVSYTRSSSRLGSNLFDPLSRQLSL